jgi:hypothetical protein
LLLDHDGQASKTLDLRGCFGDTLLERGDLLMGTGRARFPTLAFSCNGGLPLRAGTMFTLERNKLGLGFADARPELTRRFLRGGKIGLQGFHAAEVLHGGLGFGKLGMGFEQSFLRALFGVGHPGKLGLCFARLPFHRGQRLARLREPVLAIPPKLPQASLFALGRTQLLGGRVGLTACCFGGAALNLLLSG